MKIIVCGGRKYEDWPRVKQVLDEIKPTHIIQGGATGADALALFYANTHHVPCTEVPADWDGIWGKRAGLIRNRMMLDMKPDMVVAFKGRRGTAHMVEIARKAGVPVREVLDHSLEYMLS